MLLVAVATATLSLTLRSAPTLPLKAAPRASFRVMPEMATEDPPPGPPGPINWGAVAKYPFATVAEYAIIAAGFRAIDSVATLPAIAVPPLFFFLSLRSRIFSPLLASRPNRAEQGGKANPPDRKVPSWTPPGIAFPFIWLTISCLRATSSFLIWGATGRKLCSAPLLVLVLHLCVGDTWNAVTKCPTAPPSPTLTLAHPNAARYLLESCTAPHCTAPNPADDRRLLPSVWNAGSVPLPLAC